jgi:hypothetical protein
MLSFRFVGVRLDLRPFMQSLPTLTFHTRIVPARILFKPLPNHRRSSLVQIMQNKPQIPVPKDRPRRRCPHICQDIWCNLVEGLLQMLGIVLIVEHGAFSVQTQKRRHGNLAYDVVVYRVDAGWRSVCAQVVAGVETRSRVEYYGGKSVLVLLSFSVSIAELIFE